MANTGIKIDQVRSGSKTLSYDSSNYCVAVAILQTMLNTTGYNCGTPDGYFGSNTRSAARSFQSAYGLTVDGIVGVATMSALDAQVGPNCGVTLAFVAANQASYVPDTKRTNPGIADIQSKLSALGYYGSDITALYDTTTTNAVWQFQANSKLPVNEKVGYATWNALVVATGGSGGGGDSEIQAIQRRLNALLYDCGEVDGTMGPRSIWAGKWFFHRNNLGTNYTWNAQTLAALNSASAIKGVDNHIINWTAQAAPQDYLQKYSLWGNEPFDASGTPKVETIGEAGCGPTAMAIVVSTLLGKAVLPPVLAKWALENGYRDPSGNNGTYNSFFAACAEEYGLNCALRSAANNAFNEATFDMIRMFLQEGSLFVTGVNANSGLTSGGHYVVIYRIDSNDNVYIADPNNRGNTAIVGAFHTVQTWIADEYFTRVFRVWR